ncbi:hypothetical protein Vqi01_09930 [Micromonospora qiuiae]|uniref:Tn3 transposase DDE domain-containing protein n=1 Tax=Micromonospora qiuiae TaxID=502268 RepID=A0ABQ4J6M0_9ACTN|nr:hypothetical protein [Micromonospora qiuiae]GIJ25831.1 hypothetical protein Vqi01_09930 [Micromonospora qiuiae]
MLCGAEPEGRLTVTTIYADTDYLLDQLFWQYADVLRDRLDAQSLAESLTPNRHKSCGWAKNG